MITFGQGPLSRGDRVQQIAPLGLGTLEGFPYVINVVDGELELSKDPGGPPLTDLRGQPRHYPCRVFRKVTWSI